MGKRISTIIVDDEFSCIKALRSDLENYPEIEILETFTSVEKAKKAILKHQPQLLFLDIEMPKMTGVELINEISSDIHSNMCVVFYSAFNKYLIDALRVSAFDYLLKPYQSEELKSIIARVKEKVNTDNANFEQSVRRLLVDDRKFVLQTLTGLLFLHRSKILYFQYNNELRGWQMTLTDRTIHRLRVSTTSKEILNISPSFCQISQDCVINIDYLASIENASMHCVFYSPYDDLSIRVSRRYYSKLKDLLEII